MKRLLMLSCSVLALTGAAHAADIALLPHVPDNATLSATKSSAYDYLVRDDFSIGFGAPPLTYKKSNSACSLNAGAGDGGSQVPSADGKCWIAALPTILDARWWGVALNPDNFQVDPAGDPSGANFCFGTGVHACTTIQQAVSQASRFVANGGVHLVNVAAGAYIAGASCSGQIPDGANGGVGSGEILIRGAGSSTTTIADASFAAAALIVVDGCRLIPEKVKVTSVHGSALFADRNGWIGIDGNDFNVGTAALGQLHAENDGTIEISAGYTISGGAPAHEQVVLGGSIIHDENVMTVTLSGTPAFSIGFVDAEDTGSTVYIPNGFVSYSGAATGPRAYIKGNASVETNNAAAAYLPGNTPIQRVNGGVYLPEPIPGVGAPSGIGASGAAVMLVGSTDRALVFQLTPGGAGITNVGTVDIAFAGVLPNLACAAPSLITGTGVWDPQAVGGLTSFNSSGATLRFSNNGVAFTSGLTYYVSLPCNN